MKQCRADPCEFRKRENKEVVLNLVVYVDDLLVSGNETVCEKLLGVLYGQFSTQTLGERELYLGCAVERDWEKGAINISQPAMVDTLLAHFDVKHSSNTSASSEAELGPTTSNDVVTERPCRQAVGGVMWLTCMTKPDLAHTARAVARHSHNPCERH